MKKIILPLKIIFLFIANPSRSYFSVVEEVYKKELKKSPDDPYLLWFLGNIYVRYQKYKEAEILLESLLSRGRINKALILLLSKVYFNLLKYEDVKKILGTSDGIPDKEVANYYLGYSLIELGQPEEGVEYIKKYSEVNNTDFKIFGKLGYEYYKQKKYDLALEAYRKAEKLNPSKEEIKESIDLCLEKLKETNAH